MAQQDMLSQIGSIVNKARQDEGFRRNLVANSRQAIESASDIELPDNINISVLEDTPEHIHIKIPSDSMHPEALSESAPAGLKVMARASNDEQFKQRLMSNPKDVLAEEGVEVPAGTAVSVHVDTADQKYLVLPAAGDELSDDELEAVAGGEVGIALGVASLVVGTISLATYVADKADPDWWDKAGDALDPTGW